MAYAWHMHAACTACAWRMQAMYVGVAALGVSVLLAPFGGPSVPSLMLADSVPAAAAEATAGTALALLELRRQGVRPLAGASGETLAYTPAQVAPYSGNTLHAHAHARPRHTTPHHTHARTRARTCMRAFRRVHVNRSMHALLRARGRCWRRAQAAQMAPLYRIAGGEPSAAVALAAVAAWQLAIALAEELYYRGMLQGGAGFGLHALADLVAGPASAVPPAVGALTQLVALLFAAAAFGAVHTEFAADGPVVGAADGPGGDEGDSKARWFLQTGAYGAAFGALALLTQHLLAPVAMHATLNVGLCARDWQRMRNTPEEELARIFGAGEE
jgi:hypothetical protein